MIEEIVKNIKDELDRIVKEDNENIDNIIFYETSSELAIGNLVIGYGKALKILKESNNLDDCIKKLGSLINNLERVDNYNEDLPLIIDEIVHACIDRKEEDFYKYTEVVRNRLEKRIIDIIMEQV